MKYVRKHTTIPVPEVFAHDISPDNEVGAPNVLMSYIHGTSVMGHSQAREYDLDSDEKFWQRMADIQIQLASLNFDKIGSIYQEPDGSFAIGPEVVTGLGPWDDADRFWFNLAKHYFETLWPSAKTKKGTLSLFIYQPSSPT